MNSVEVPKLYKKYFIDKDDERKKLFKMIYDIYKPQKGIYPGSFVHITPSFYIKEMTYIDSDKRIAKFFDNENVLNYICENKNYSDEPNIKAFQGDFSSLLAIDENSFDIMFSFYAGFISQSCKKYLRSSGVLVCNNSHGDASLAFTDEDYKLIAVIKRNGSKFRIVDKDLDSYSIKRDGTHIDRNKVLKTMIGEIFTQKAYAYIFRFNPK
ncbi:hypothetical protein EW093_08520 [Thiospirochaeta perfilievii]|uniref:Class I SAM-dependent methyltransferase n=1 Tax=Thiospirochaeta perfilievii TaxID=252967 RepID=A0A5C1QB74_9SPIO|nr:hypothetical protein [Thiospirochaeta perfilievii]QEN04747.1 hypothetical protein EW093_08520 [Thiospirochaeta perfilievii]